MPSRAASDAFLTRHLHGPLPMLGLVRFRTIADYSAAPHLAPPSPISAANAYEKYIAHATPFLERSGGIIVYRGSGGPWLIGLEQECWHHVILVRHAALESFLAFSENEDFLAGLGHRSAAAEDTRVLPIRWAGRLPYHV